MQQYSIHIDTTKLTKLLQSCFEKLPEIYFKAFEDFLKLRSKSFFRESLISNWISIPVSNSILFKDFQATYRIRNIIIPTINKLSVELQVYLDQKGIFGINIGADLENLITDQIDTSQFIIEIVPTSKFLTNHADLEYLDDFDEIDDYLDNKYSSEEFTINHLKYYSIITLPDNKCIAIDEKRSVFLLNKISGQAKFLCKYPSEFVREFQVRKLSWLS